MSNLPSRDSFKRAGVTLMDAKPILAVYVRGELLTAAEWRDIIDYERIEEILVEFGGDWYDAVIREGQIYDFGRVKDALAAAFGDTR